MRRQTRTTVVGYGGRDIRSGMVAIGGPPHPSVAAAAAVGGAEWAQAQRKQPFTVPGAARTAPGFPRNPAGCKGEFMTYTSQFLCSMHRFGAHVSSILSSRSRPGARLHRQAGGNQDGCSPAAAIARYATARCRGGSVATARPHDRAVSARAGALPSGREAPLRRYASGRGGAASRPACVSARFGALRVTPRSPRARRRAWLAPAALPAGALPRFPPQAPGPGCRTPWATPPPPAARRCWRW